MRARNKSVEDIAPEAFLRYAQSYLKAAEDLLSIQGIDLVGIQEPVYFLYSHSIELSLKAHLRVLGVSTEDLIHKFGHGLTSLLKAHKELTDGLDLESELSIRHVVDLLERGNINQGLRYYTMKKQYLPSLPWTQSVAKKAIGAAELAVRDKPSTSLQSDAADKVTIIWGKPGSPSRMLFENTD